MNKDLRLPDEAILKIFKDREWLIFEPDLTRAQVVADAQIDYLLSKVDTPEKLKVEIADWLYNFVLNYIPTEREKFNEYAVELAKLSQLSTLQEKQKARKEERKAIQDFYQTKNGDIVIPKEDWQALQSGEAK